MSEENKAAPSVLRHILIWFLIISSIVGIIGLVYFLFTSKQDLFIGLLAGLVPTAVTIWQYRKQTKREHEQWLLRNRDAFMIEIINIFVSMLDRKDKTDSEQEQKELLERIRALRPALLAHAPASTLRAYTALQDLSGKNTMREGERFFRAIRKDLGHDDSKLKPGEVWGTLLDKEGREEILRSCRGERYDDL